jgi:conjugative transfer signal peptidase TraF
VYFCTATARFVHPVATSQCQTQSVKVPYSTLEMYFAIEKMDFTLPYKWRVLEKLVRLAAIGIVSLLFLGWIGIQAGLRFNGSQSFPEGLYLATGKAPQKGDLVFVNIPGAPIFSMAGARGYLNVAYSPTPHLLKRLVGVAGDRVTISTDGVLVNGVRLTNSAPLHCDASGRTLHAYVLTDYILGPNEVLLMSDYNRASFDSRYFGPIQATTIESVVTPLFAWD